MAPALISAIRCCPGGKTPGSPSPKKAIIGTNRSAAMIPPATITEAIRGPMM